MPDRVISVPQATQIAQRIKNKFDNVNGRLGDVMADLGDVMADLGDITDYNSMPITGTDESGKTINSTAKVADAAFSYHCVTYPISGGDRVKISGSASARGYYYIFTDGSATLKTSKVNDTSKVTSIVDVIDTAPNGASYLIVSYNIGNAYTKASAEKVTEIAPKGVNKLTERVSVLEGLTDNTVENTTSVPQDAITIVDNYYTSTTGGNTASAMWRYITYIIPPDTEGLQVTAVAGQLARLWMLLDSNNRILEMSSYNGAPVALTEVINLSNYPSARKVIVNDKKSSDLAISTVVYDKVIDGHNVYVDNQALPSILNDHSDDKMYGKTICACGDSITFGADMDADGIVQTSNIDVYQSNGSGVFSKTTANFRKTWNYIIASRHNMTLYNAGVSGSTMQAISERAGFSISNGRYTKLPDNLDYLLIFFGWNDMAYGTLGTIEDPTNESYYGGYNVVLPYLINKYPYTKIGLIVPFGTDAGHRQAIRDLGNKWGVAVWDNYQGGTPLYYGKEDSVGIEVSIVTANRAKFQANGAHPNHYGHEQLADMIEGWLKTI